MTYNNSNNNLQGNLVKSQTFSSTQDGYALTWVNADGYIEAKPISVTLGGDVTGSTTANTVSKISGSSPIAITPQTLQWLNTTLSPTITQPDQTTNTTNGQPLKIQAQNATGTTSTGGQLTLNAGSGTNTSSSGGAVSISAGAGSSSTGGIGGAVNITAGNISGSGTGGGVTITSGSSTSGSPGTIIFQSGGTGSGLTVMKLGSGGISLGYSGNAITVPATGNLTLSSTQYLYPYIKLGGGTTLTGNVTITFPTNVSTTWTIEVDSGITLNSHTLIFNTTTANWATTITPGNMYLITVGSNFHIFGTTLTQ